MKGSKDLMISENKEEDTLSLSDLIPIHDDDNIDSEECEKYYDSKSSTTNSSDDIDHEDVFEFIGSHKNNVLILPDNILFCGKLIPNKSNNNNNNPILSSMPKKRSFSLSRRNNKLLGYNPTHQEMELKDLKNRLNRKVVGDAISDGKYGKGNGKGKSILWSLINTLSCTSGGASYHAQSVVKASIGCISLV